jgi:hypothetical protein
MKRTFTAVLLLAFSAAIVGCEASAQIGEPDGTTIHDDGYNKTTKTTTVREPDGDVKTKTETHVDR